MLQNQNGYKYFLIGRNIICMHLFGYLGPEICQSHLKVYYPGY